MSDESIDELLNVVGRKIYWTAFDLIQGDPHQWSERGCQTCRSITSIIGKPFGCILYAQQRSQQRAKDLKL